MIYNVRLATDKDFESIYQIWLEGIENSFDLSAFDEAEIKQRFLKNFNERNGIFNFWIAIDTENNILGWQSLMEVSNNPFKHKTWAESSTYITRNTRLKGIGKSLLDFVIKEAENSSLEYIMGFVSLTNAAARKITQDTGWIEVGTLPKSKKGNNKFDKTILIRPV